ncbi:MAG: ATP-grasp domain-containing protein [Eubacteriales bacterium]|nr:ATP-grasp domain-containing protein [Eubacteriales bacterium]
MIKKSEFSKMSDRKKIMILGAGIYQVPLIKTAGKMGLFTVVVSIPGEYPGFRWADKIYHIDTRDKRAILEIAKQEKISGICTAGTDVAVASIGYVCEKMGLAGLSEMAASCVTDKARMKEAFVRGQVSTAKYRKAFTAIEAEEAAQEIGFPVVVKRVDSSGSRGITIVEKAAGIREAFARAMECSCRDYVLVEELLTGKEIGVDGMIQDGRVVFAAPHEKLLFRGERITVPAGHGFPLNASKAQIEEITRQMQLAAKAAGMDQCPFNADVMVNGNRVSVIEMGGRTGATCIPELISMYYGFDFYEMILRNAMGLSVDFTESEEKIPCMARLLMSPVDGTITRIDEAGLQEIRDKGTEVVLDFPTGHPVEKMENGTTRIGHVIARAESEQELEEVVNRVNRCISINDRSLEELWRK